jgi:aspartyl-tRNA(Asn)/glutamyl-tRNA(Gln) amidotransferase subunit B
VRQEVLGFINDRGLSPAMLTPEMLAELVGLVTDGTISRGQGKDVLSESMAEDKWPRDIVEARGLAQVSDAGEIGAVVEAVLAANASTVEEYRAAEDDKTRKNKRNALMGKIMGELKGKGDPRVVNALLDTHLT